MASNLGVVKASDVRSPALINSDLSGSETQRVSKYFVLFQRLGKCFFAFLLL